tara:strand:+ start:1123 stop:1332 length:210 start_codon:yes stop_codon:yes gene_type:complete
MVNVVFYFGCNEIKPYNYLSMFQTDKSLGSNQQYESTTIVRLKIRNNQKNKNFIFISTLFYKFYKIYLN